MSWYANERMPKIMRAIPKNTACFISDNGGGGGGGGGGGYLGLRFPKKMAGMICMPAFSISPNLRVGCFGRLDRHIINHFDNAINVGDQLGHKALFGGVLGDSADCYNAFLCLNHGL